MVTLFWGPGPTARQNLRDIGHHDYSIGVSDAPPVLVDSLTNKGWRLGCGTEGRERERETRRWRWPMMVVVAWTVFHVLEFPRILPSEINIRPRLRIIITHTHTSSPLPTNPPLSRQLPGLRELYEMSKHTSSLSSSPRGERARRRPTRLIFSSRESAG